MLRSMMLATLAALAGAVGPGTRVPGTFATTPFPSRDPREIALPPKPLRGPLTLHDHLRIAKAREKRQRKAEARLRRL